METPYIPFPPSSNDTSFFKVHRVIFKNSLKTAFSTSPAPGITAPCANGNPDPMLPLARAPTLWMPDQVGHDG